MVVVGVLEVVVTSVVVVGVLEVVVVPVVVVGCAKGGEVETVEDERMWEEEEVEVEVENEGSKS
eukprot:CAMPEP_0174264134 /NCGR_PEP_ID=MMETSP0439-20130205/21446_1 /TAXON_ID=0 /ORGANISM="Stereomyxa ramosa, Strain Chinc5" /LENGTH=63 /DNA_ID=CAMNT_0015349867 /DNA_START=231 /DNA_END=422 /DNA_ORIENTATION=-